MRRLLICAAFAASAFGQVVVFPGGSGGTGGGVSSVATGCGLTGGTITSTGTISLGWTVNAQTGTSYTVLSTDCGKLVTFSNASAVAVTLPQGTGSFAAPFTFQVQNLGAGSVTITPTTSTINGGASLVLATGQGVQVFTDGSGNFQIQGGNGNGGSTAFTQTVTAVSSIAITHNLGTSQPWVTCYDSSGNVLGGTSATTFITNIVATSTNVATVTFSGTTTGVCRVSTGSIGATGPTGAAGANGVSYNWRGAWSSATTYAPYDSVSYGGSSYVSILSGTNQQPDISPTYWGTLASKGAAGTGGSVSITADTTSSRAFSSADIGTLVNRSNAAANLLDTIPQAGTSGMTSGSIIRIKNLNAAGGGVITLTPTTSTINGAARMFILPGQLAEVYNDGSNYTAIVQGRAIFADTWQFNTANMIATDNASYSGVTATQISATNTDQSFGVSCPLPANLPANAKLRITADTIFTAGASTVGYTPKLKVGSTGLWVPASSNFVVSSTAVGQQYQWLVTVSAAPGSSVVVDANFATASAGASRNTVFAPTVATNAAWTIQPTIQFNSNAAGYMFAIRGWVVEWVNQ